MAFKPVIVVHGGAWAIPDDLAESTKTGVKSAAKCGFYILANGGKAIDAVESAVRILEDNKVFDAGHGAVLNAEGEVELDAVIMDGRNLAVGAVSCIKNIANPVMFARTVMEKTPHAMLTGIGANKFAETMNIERVPNEKLVTELAKREWELYQKYKQSVTCLFNTERAHDTVGAVAIDCEGNVACATSTGGITNKMVGRVGDSPIIGSGAYADNFTGAVSTTGHGESILKVTLARLVLFNMERVPPRCDVTDCREWNQEGQCHYRLPRLTLAERDTTGGHRKRTPKEYTGEGRRGTAVDCGGSLGAGDSPQDAADHALEYMKNKVNGRGGLIVVSRTGEWAARFSTKRMAWASIENHLLTYGFNPDEAFQENVAL